MNRNFFNEFRIGITSYKTAFSFVREHNLWAFVWIPIAINLFLFGISALAFYQIGAEVLAYLEAQLLPAERMAWWALALSYLLRFVIYMLMGLLYLKSYRYLMMIFLLPSLGILAGKVQDILHPALANQPFSWKQFISDIWRGLGLSLYCISIELALTIPLLLLSLFFPVLSLFFTLLIILIESYFLGFGVIDLRNEWARLSAKFSKRLIFNRLGFTLSVGLLHYALLLVPILGVLFSPIWACVAAGLGIFRVEGELKSL
ncbi:MAG: EI24 domain-containing protein [Bernardetiaceae bacterium]|nr:EI24 domain-containing protein [Bernardetiaceae bacterium]